MNDRSIIKIFIIEIVDPINIDNGIAENKIKKF